MVCRRGSEGWRALAEAEAAVPKGPEAPQEFQAAQLFASVGRTKDCYGLLLLIRSWKSSE